MAEELVEKVNRQYVEEYLPAIVIVILVIVVGLSGNTFAAIYYGFKAPKSVVQFLMFALAMNDAITNIVLVDDIVVFFYFVKYENDRACKTLFVLRHWLVANSLLFMVAIAIDRFRRVCLPFSSQFTVRNMQFIMLGLSVFSFALSFRYFFTTAVIRNNISAEANATKGFYCTYSDGDAHKLIEGVFHYIDICTHAIVILSLIVLYSSVVRKIIKSKDTLIHHKKRSMAVYQRNQKNSEETNGSTTEVVEFRFSETDVESDYGTVDKPKTNASEVAGSNVQTKTSTQLKEKTSTLTKLSTLTRRTIYGGLKKLQAAHKSDKDIRFRAEVKVTVMVAVITLLSVLCFVPFYLSILFIESNLSGNGLIMSVGNIILRRSYMLNSAINPIILTFFDDLFRTFLRSVFCKKNDQ